MAGNYSTLGDKNAPYFISQVQISCHETIKVDNVDCVSEVNIPSATFLMKSKENAS
jgi:hypothetical protein